MTFFFQRIRTFDALGKVDHALIASEAGFKVGQFIQRKRDKIIARIEAFEGSSVRVRLDDGPLSGSCRFPVESLLSSSWKVVQPKAEPETLCVEELQQMLPCKSSEMQVQTLRGKVMQAVWDLEEKHSKVYDALSVQMKPSKAVFSTVGFAKHKLVLVPCSWKIEGRRPGDDVKPQKNSVCLGKLSLGEQQYSFYINPCFVGPDKDGKLDKSFLSPFFFVRSTWDQEGSNMEVHPPFDSDTTNASIRVPCLRNTKPVRPGDELLCFCPSVAIEEAIDEELEAVVPTGPPTKRVRTKSSGQ